MKKLIYTFRTNPFKEILKENYPEIIVLGRLNEGIEKIKELLLTNCPKLLIGCAKSNRSCLEGLAINTFHKKVISVRGPESYKLFVPEEKLMRLSNNPTTSFCNWTAYRLSEFIYNNNLDTKFIFIHFSDSDFDKLNLFLDEL